MNANTFNRLHGLRMENDAARYAMDEMRPRFDKLAGRHENGNAPRAVTAYQLFQTPVELATKMVALLNLKPGERVLEPSAGLGRILDAITQFNPCEIVAVEIAASCAGELFKQDRPNVAIKQRDFLSVTPDELGLFDAIAMNPPFHMRSDIKHILHARTFLKPGGKLVAICMDGASRLEALKPIASHWENLPPESFRESGTNVGTALLVISQPF